MTFEPYRKKPQVARDPDGRVAVYVGAAYQVMDEAAARSLRDQLTEVLEKAGPQKDRT